MYDGEIVETGAVADVIDDPQHEYTRKLSSPPSLRFNRDGQDTKSAAGSPESILSKKKHPAIDGVFCFSTKGMDYISSMVALLRRPSM